MQVSFHADLDIVRRVDVNIDVNADMNKQIIEGPSAGGSGPHSQVRFWGCLIIMKFESPAKVVQVILGEQSRSRTQVGDGWAQVRRKCSASNTKHLMGLTNPAQ